MSKASRRMMKQRSRQESARKAEARKTAPELTETEAQELQHLFETEQYADYINRLAEIVQAGRYDDTSLYHGAYSYFMLGDYLRATNMVNDILTMYPAHLEARILLARICILDDRTDDGLAIFDYILEHFRTQLSESQEDDLKDILDYYASTEAEKIQANFPYVASFLQSAGLLPEAAAAETKEMEAPEEKPAAEASPAHEEEEGQAEALVPQAQAATPDAAAEIDQVMAQPVSLADKVRLLNAFAAAHFVTGAAEYAIAQAELEQALALDAASAETLRNLAVLAKCQGETEKALAFASKLPTSDFLLLSFLGK